MVMPLVFIMLLSKVDINLERNAYFGEIIDMTLIYNTNQCGMSRNLILKSIVTEYNTNAA